MENKLDGNAAGGILQEFFPFDMTLVQATCIGCGATDAIGTLAYLPSRDGDGQSHHGARLPVSVPVVLARGVRLHPPAAARQRCGR